LPWVNPDAGEIQSSNFAIFRKNLPEYEMLLSVYETYCEIFLDTARKLLLIFNLEEEAELCFQTIVKYNSKIDEAFFVLGKLAEKKGNYQNALELYKKVISVNPNNAYAHMQIGLINATILENYEEALLHFSKASEEDPYSVEPYVRMAESAYKLGNIPQARQYLEVALGINEYQEEALNLQGTILWKIDKNYEEAVEIFERGIDHKMHKDSALLLRSLGDIHAQHFQDYNKAKVFYEKSLKINPCQKSLIEYFVPFILKHFQDLGAVEKSYTDYLVLKPKDADILTAYADFLNEYLKDYDTAYHYLEQAIEINPDHSIAQKLLRKIADYVEDFSNKRVIKDIDEDDEGDEDDELIQAEEEWFDDEEDEDFSGGGSVTDN
jgi:tetratricopeptide (TPR) repeat protein